jgi:hypothetical protein
MSLVLLPARTLRPIQIQRRLAAQWPAPLLKQTLAFFFGFCIQFNMLLGGGGQGASAVGGFGYHLLDFVALGATCLLVIHSFTPRRILSLALYGLILGALFLPTAQTSDIRTSILAYHYILYGLAALYVAVLLDDSAALERFCAGLIIGMLATIPIFILQDSVYSSMLVAWGLTPGYAQVFGGIVRDVPRYSGLGSHPNETAHVAALSAAAGAYFCVVRRRLLPLAFVAAGLLVVFYYTWCRGGLIAGGLILAIPFLFGSGRTSIFRIAIIAVIIILGAALLSQVDFVAARFANDPNISNNTADRVDSVVAGLQVLLTHPFGMSVVDFNSLVAAGSGGVESPHNGFIFFGGIFGFLSLAVLLAAFTMNLRLSARADVFFAAWTLLICVSFLFEQLPGSYSYAFAICLAAAHVFLKTRLGKVLKAHAVRPTVIVEQLRCKS